MTDLTEKYTILRNENIKLYKKVESADEILEQHETLITELTETNEALKSELKEVCDVLIRKCPEMKEWVMLNWKNLYELEK